MLDQKSLENGQRLVATLRLIESVEYSTPLLAEKVGVSVPTISRCITALRLMGRDIRGERRDGGRRSVLGAISHPRATSATKAVGQ